ncbi:hypothetical protein ACIQ9P_26480 [Kitasatospora sp. NPDC094019]|uniref:hypothetical protein n=1 Tax=Kitasatospora sp. NPDC094019 TaxID=3364091 RepID=UPI0037FF8F2D
MTDTARPDPAAPVLLELSTTRTRPQPAHRDLGRAILDGPLVRGAIWLRWTGHDGIRTLHRGAGPARGWVEKDIDGLIGWAALVDGRLVVTRDSAGRTHPVLHTESWEAGGTLYAALAQHPAHPDDQSTDEDESGDPEDGLLGETRSRIRRRAAGLTPAAIDQALADAHTDLRTADQHADAGDESTLARAVLAYQEWQRIRDEAATAAGETYDPDRDLGLQRAQSAARHRQDVAQCAAEAAHDARKHTDTAHRRLAGAAADPLYTALARAGLHTLTDDDHQAVRELTRHLGPTTVQQVANWLERTRATAHALTATQERPARPVVRRSGS